MTFGRREKADFEQGCFIKKGWKKGARQRGRKRKGSFLSFIRGGDKNALRIKEVRGPGFGVGLPYVLQRQCTWAKWGGMVMLGGTFHFRSIWGGNRKTKSLFGAERARESPTFPLKSWK